MNCPNCGAEIDSNSKFCDACGSQISYEMKRELEQLNKQGCPKCGSSNVSFSREKEREVKNKKGTTIVRNTVGVCKDCGHTWYVTDESSNSKSKLWLWVLGWICIFPVPLTILILRNKEMKSGIKYGIIAAVWIIYLLIGIGSSKTDKPADTPSKIEATTENTNTTTEEQIQNSDVMDVTMKVEPNVNKDDGTVLFGVSTNLPERTELLVTVKNNEGYTAQDKAIILKDGNGYTAEFSNNGKGLKGKYTVSVSMSLPKLQKDEVRKVIGEHGEKIGGQYVHQDTTSNDNVVSAEFEFEF